jgi:hypothetical protein
MCSICLEENDNNKYIFTKGYSFIQNNICYSIDCKCNVQVHEDCIRIWLNQNNKCIICNKNIPPLENLDDKIKEQLKELYLFEIFILLILLQINIIVYNTCYVLSYIIILIILLFYFVNMK